MASMRKTKIVATLGPATDDEAILRQLIEAGADVLRLNFSYGDHATHAKRIALVWRLGEEARCVVAVLQDLQGPRIRVGRLATGPVELREGAAFAITTRDVAGTAERVSTTYQDLPRDVQPGDAILLDDGLLELRVTGVSRSEVKCTVVRGGTLRPHKGMNLPGVSIRAPALTDKDRDDLRFGLAEGVDMVALSFVRHPDDAEAARTVMRGVGRRVPLLAKIETPQALDRLEDVVRAFDGVMIARGDLGVELSAEKVPGAQKRIIERANLDGKPVITATEMLESMTHNLRPTRAEASDVANAVLDGTDAVMLSGETAIGEYPVEAVRAMDRIVREAETLAAPAAGKLEGRQTQAHAVCHAAVTLAAETKAEALAAFTRSGRTAQLLSKLRPDVAVYALCEEGTMARQLTLWRGVIPLVVETKGRVGDVAERIGDELQARGLLRGNGDVVIVGAAPGTPAGRTNFIRVLQLAAHRRGRG